jgi:phosphatidylglycerophosphate synthase
MVQLASASKRPMVLDERFDVSVSRPLARWMARHFHRLGFSADQVSMIAMGCGVSAGFAFISGGLWSVLGGLLLLAMVVIDCADGEVARLSPPSDKPWRGRMLDGMADLMTVLSVHIAMVVILTRDGLVVGGHPFGVLESLVLVVLGFVSFSWNSSVVDDIKQRLRPASVDRDLAQYADQKKTLFESFLYFVLVRYVKILDGVTGHGRPGGYELFQQVAIVGPTHHLVAIAIAGMFAPLAPSVFLTYLLVTIGPGNLYLWSVLHRARRREVTI